MIDNGRRFYWVLLKNHRVQGTFGFPTSAMAFVRKHTKYEERQWFSSKEGLLSSWASKPDDVDPDEYEVILAPHELRIDEETGETIHPLVKNLFQDQEAKDNGVQSNS